MASLTAAFKLGSGGATSLISTAASVANKVSEYNDQVQALQWDASAKTQEDYNTYAKYLKTRVTNLQSTSNITDSTKAVEMQKTLMGAQKTFTSSQIQRASIAIVTGNASSTDKYQTILTLYNQAASTGDAGLQQSLALQADQLSQKIQYDEDQANSAAETLAKANTTKEGAQQEDVATQLQGQLRDLDAAFQAAGQQNINSLTKEWAAKVTPQLKALGVNVPKGAQPNYLDLVSGLVTGIYNAHTLAATTLANTDPVAADSYTQDAMAIATGQTTFKVGGLSVNATQLQTMATNPDSYSIRDVNGTTSLVQNQIASYSMKNGQLTPNYTSTGTTTLSKMTVNGKAATDVLKQVGINVIDSGTKAVIQGSSKTNFLKKIPGLAQGEEFNVLQTNQGLQFQTKDAAGKVHLYYLTTDSSGKAGVVEDLGNGKLSMVAGQYGFTPNVSGMVANASQNQISQQRTASLLASVQQKASTQFGKPQSLAQVQAQVKPFKPIPLAPATPDVVGNLQGAIQKGATNPQKTAPTPQKASGATSIQGASGAGSLGMGLSTGNAIGAGGLQ